MKIDRNSEEYRKGSELFQKIYIGRFKGRSSKSLVEEYGKEIEDISVFRNNLNTFYKYKTVPKGWLLDLIRPALTDEEYNQLSSCVDFGIDRNKIVKPKDPEKELLRKKKRELSRKRALIRAWEIEANNE